VSLGCSHKKQPTKDCVAVRTADPARRRSPIRQSEGASVESSVTSIGSPAERFKGNDRVLFGIILGVITFWLFAQTTLNIALDMGRDLGLRASTMNTAVALTALF
jgi:hypothetical protein